MTQFTGLDIGGAGFENIAAGQINATAAVAGVKAAGTLTVADYTSIKVITPATGTVTFSGQPSDGDTVTINGVVFTFKTALTAQHQVLIGGTATVTAQNFRAVVNIFTALLGVAASGASTTITLTANAKGAGGNSITLTKSGANIAVSGATLSGGLDADTISVNGSVFTFVNVAPANSAQIQAGSSNNDAASKIATAVGAIPQQTNVTAVAASAIVTFTAQTAGVAGNSIGLVAANVTAFTLSGATLAGGVLPAAASANYAEFVKIADAKNAAPRKTAFANVALSTTDGLVITAVAGKKLRVMALSAQPGATATDVTFNSKGAGAGTAITPLFSNGVHSALVLPYNPDGWFETNAGEGLTATTGTGSATGILVDYAEV